MGCTPFAGPDGLRGFICSRGPKRPAPRRYCVVCLAAGVKTPAPFLCDYPVSSPPHRKTCDRALCREHATAASTKGIDYCPEHA